MVDDKARKRRRRRRVSPEAPVEMACTVPGWREAPRRTGFLARPVTALVSLLPAHRGDAAGRRLAIAIRIAIGAGAFALAGLGLKHPAFAALAAVVALSTLVLPLADYRKRRWFDRARALAAPRRIPQPSAGTLHYDGNKLTLRADDRVWQSLRPRHPQLGVVVTRHGDRALLGLIAPNKKRAGSVWFAAPLAEIGATYDPVEDDPRFAPETVGDAVTVSGADWVALHEALWDPTTSGLPRPPGPARA